MKFALWTAVICTSFFAAVVGALSLSRNLSVEVFPPQTNAVDLATRIPICLDRSNIPDEEIHWLYIPASPGELATSEYYGFLSGQLIKAGVVDASQCPLGGLWPTGYANSCGLEKAHEAVVYLQNVYDDEILSAGTQTGVPPVMLKQLFRYESQFWPVKMGLYHFGLGHLTYIGAENALAWSPDLYQDICVSTLGSACESPFVRQSLETKNLLTNKLTFLLDASCPTCTYKIDIPKAEKSVSYIAKAIMGYCRQTSQIVQNATDKSPEKVVDYSTIWKLTLVNYNMGPSCVYNAVQTAYKKIDPDSGKKLTWDMLAYYLDIKDCSQGVKYVKSITGEYYKFETNP